MIGEAIGKTKNAVVGQANRMKVDLTPKPGFRSHRGGRNIVLGLKSQTRQQESCAATDSGGEKMGRKRKQAIVKPKPEALNPPPAPPPDPLPLEQRLGAALAVFHVKSHHCLWPINDPKHDDFHYCSARRALDGPPYCREHQKACGHG